MNLRDTRLERTAATLALAVIAYCAGYVSRGREGDWVALLGISSVLALVMFLLIRSFWKPPA
jgi:hypothetical protein